LKNEKLLFSIEDDKTEGIMPCFALEVPSINELCLGLENFK
jgi:hypothetical protein